MLTWVLKRKNRDRRREKESARAKWLRKDNSVDVACLIVKIKSDLSYVAHPLDHSVP